MNEFDINSALGSSDGGYEVSEPTNGWGDGWGEDGSAKVERDRLEYKDGEFYNAHIIEWSFKDLDQIEGKAPKRILDFYLRIHWQNEAGESVTANAGLRGIWLTMAYNGAPADLSELIRLGVDALGKEAPRTASGKPRVDATYGPQWWCESMIGRPIRVKAKARSYTAKNGEERTTFDLYPAGPWPEGEIL